MIFMPIVNPVIYVCFKLEEKTTRSVNKNKNNFINVIRDRFPMSVDEENLQYHFVRSVLVV